MALMDLVTGIGIAIGIPAVGLLIASLFSPSVAMWTSTVFSKIVDGLRSILEFFVHRIPRPLQIGLILVLFGAVSGIVYTFTVGASYVCVDKNIYHTDMFTGLSYQLWDPVDPLCTGANEGKCSNARELASVNTDGSVSRVFYGDVMVGNRTNLVDVNRMELEGKIVDVTYVAAAITDISVSRKLDKFVGVPEEQRLEQWLRGQESVQYNVCQDPVSKACVLDRYILGFAGGKPQWKPACGGFVGFSGDLQSVAMITYDVDMVRKTIEVTVDSSVGKTVKVNGTNDYQVKSCSNNPPGDSFPWTDSANLKWYRKGFLWLKPESVDITVFNADFVPLIEDEESGDTAVDTSVQQMAAISQQAQQGGGKLGSPVRFSDGDIVKISCDDSAGRPYATKMTVMGLNPFSFQTMLLVVAAMMIISVWGWFRKGG